MTTVKQIEANRLNALRSTGPRTEDGKQRSRCNAIRHGLTAETVIVGLEDIEDYEAFEATIIAGRARIRPSPSQRSVATSPRRGNRNLTLSIRDKTIRPISIENIQPSHDGPISGYQERTENIGRPWSGLKKTDC